MFLINAHHLPMALAGRTGRAHLKFTFLHIAIDNITPFFTEEAPDINPLTPCV